MFTQRNVYLNRYNILKLNSTTGSIIQLKVLHIEKSHVSYKELFPQCELYDFKIKLKECNTITHGHLHFSPTQRDIKELGVDTNVIV